MGRWGWRSEVLRLQHSGFTDVAGQGADAGGGGDADFVAGLGRDCRPAGAAGQRVSAGGVGVSGGERDRGPDCEHPVPVLAGSVQRGRDCRQRAAGGVLQSAASAHQPVPLLGAASHLADAAGRVFPSAHLPRGWAGCFGAAAGGNRGPGSFPTHRGGQRADRVAVCGLRADALKPMASEGSDWICLGTASNNRKYSFRQ